MINLAILTSLEVAQCLNYEDISDMPSKVVNIIYPAVESYIYNATGKDWAALTTTYTAIDPLAKMVAGALTARWFEDSANIGQVKDLGLLSMITQLEAKYLVEKQVAS